MDTPKLATPWPLPWPITCGHPQRQAALGALTMALGMAMSACGGGSEELALSQVRASAVQTQAAAPAKVRLEGCVVDEYYIPRTGTQVRLLGADGRLLGHATSDKNGVFAFQAPARQAVSVNVDFADGDAMQVSVGRSNLTVAACLSDPRS